MPAQMERAFELEQFEAVKPSKDRSSPVITAGVGQRTEAFDQLGGGDLDCLDHPVLDDPAILRGVPASRSQAETAWTDIQLHSQAVSPAGIRSFAMAADWLLIDGSSVMFRAFFGIPVTAFKASDGQPVNAVRGFLDMLARLVTDRKPRAILVATDEDWRPKFRVDVIPSYKTARLERGNMPPELEPQEPIIREVLAAIGVEVVGSDGFEAEDVIASLLPKIRGKVEIVTGDR
ncbi:MAG: hypothetical protein E6H90_00140, partial [Chloroflexi bacterium]